MAFGKEKKEQLIVVGLLAVFVVVLGSTLKGMGLFGSGKKASTAATSGTPEKSTATS